MIIVVIAVLAKTTDKGETNVPSKGETNVPSKGETNVPSNDPAEECKRLSPFCISATPATSNSWDIKCKGQEDNQLIMNTPNDWTFGLTTNELAKHFSSPYAALNIACPPFLDPEEECKLIPRQCTSAKQTGLNDWTITCIGQSPSILHKNASDAWLWKDSGTANTYTNPLAAIRGRCPLFENPDGACTLVKPMCISSSKVSEKDWDVSCMGQPTRTLHKNEIDKWIWMDGAPTIYSSALDAIQKTCLYFQDPSRQCSFIDNCISATPISDESNNKWTVKCNMMDDNTLMRETPTKWRWMDVYSTYPATQQAYSDAYSAIHTLCPLATSLNPAEECRRVPNCISSTPIPNTNNKDWTIKCQGQYDSILSSQGENLWRWDTARPELLSKSYTDPHGALVDACVQFDDPILACNNHSSTCISAGSSPDPKEWKISCKHQTDSLLRMESPTEWRWSEGGYFSDGILTKFKDPLAAIINGCPEVIEPTCPVYTSCQTITPVGLREWKVTCEDKRAGCGTDELQMVDGKLQCPSGIPHSNELQVGFYGKWTWKFGGGSYDSSTQAIQDECVISTKFDEPAPHCSEVKECSYLEDMGTDREWLLGCHSYPSNTLHMSTPSDWSFGAGYNKATFAHYPTPLDAIQGVCPSYDDPTTLCLPEHNCVSVSKNDINQWDIKCTVPVSRRLDMKFADDWRLYNDYQTIYTSPSLAINNACPMVESPEQSCKDNCIKVQKGDSTGLWDVYCQGQRYPKQLSLSNDYGTEWMVPEGRFTTASEAIQKTCPTFPVPTCTNQCSSITQINPQEWNVSCLDSTTNNLIANTPTEWLWKSSVPGATDGKYTDPTTAINAQCTPVSDPTKVCSGCCTQVTVSIPNERWKVQGKLGFDNYLYYDGSTKQWYWQNYDKLFPGTSQRYSSPLSAIQGACPDVVIPACPDVPGCSSIQQSYPQMWDINCGWNAVSLQYLSPKNWAVNDRLGTGVRYYSSANDAINLSCQTQTQTIPCSPEIPACQSVSQTSARQWQGQCGFNKVLLTAVYTNSPSTIPYTWQGTDSYGRSKSGSTATEIMTSLCTN
jgi:hypothetical protein